MKNPLMMSFTRLCAPKPKRQAAHRRGRLEWRHVEAEFRKRHQHRDGHDHSGADAVKQPCHCARLLLAHLCRARLSLGDFHQPGRQSLQHASQNHRDQHDDENAHAACPGQLPANVSAVQSWDAGAELYHSTDAPSLARRWGRRRHLGLECRWLGGFLCYASRACKITGSLTARP